MYRYKNAAAKNAILFPFYYIAYIIQHTDMNQLYDR